MSNMSYCRFQNTRGDLRDCVDALESGDLDKQEEVRAALAMGALCQRFLDALETSDLEGMTWCKDCNEPLYNGGTLCRDCKESDEEDAK